jgi:hypothetical protein
LEISSKKGKSTKNENIKAKIANNFNKYQISSNNTRRMRFCQNEPTKNAFKTGKNRPLEKLFSLFAKCFKKSIW